MSFFSLVVRHMVLTYFFDMGSFHHLILKRKDCVLSVKDFS